MIFLAKRSWALCTKRELAHAIGQVRNARTSLCTFLRTSLKRKIPCATINGTRKACLYTHRPKEFGAIPRPVQLYTCLQAGAALDCYVAVIKKVL